MSTVAELIAEVKSVVEALPGLPVRMASDYRTDFERIAAGTTRYQIEAGVAAVDRRNSNVDRTAVLVRLRILHRLVTAFAERTYTEAHMQAHLARVVDLHWWRDLASVNEVLVSPSVTIERVGNVFALETSLTVVLKP
jgi:hypothetical protein